MLGEEIYTQHDENQRPVAVQAEVESRVEQKKQSQADENSGSDWNFRLAFGFFGRCSNSATAEHGSQTKRIGCRLSQLNRPGGTNRVDDLVNVEERDADP